MLLYRWRCKQKCTIMTTKLFSLLVNKKFSVHKQNVSMVINSAIVVKVMFSVLLCWDLNSLRSIFIGHKAIVMRPLPISAKIQF